MRVLAAPLRRHAGHRPLQDLEQRLLHPFAGDVPGNGGILRLAGYLIHLVDVYDPSLRPFHVVVGRLNQLEQYILDVLTHVAGLGKGGGIGDAEGHVEHPGQGLGQQGLAAPGRTDEDDVALLQFHIVIGIGANLDALVVIVDGHG